MSDSYNDNYGYDPDDMYNKTFVESDYTVTDEPDKKKGKKEKVNMRKRSLVMIIILCVVLSSIVGFGGGYLAFNLMGGQSASGSPVLYQSVQRTASGDDSSLGLSPADVAELVKDSVVAITTETVQYGYFMQQYVSEGAGSGVVITEDGYILTNNHVIQGANSIMVTLQNGETYNAVVVGSDSENDIAVLKIEAKGLTPAVFGNSDELRMGDMAIVIGNPLGTLGGSLTQGRISALEREIELEGQTMTLLQTDAAVNPGNSGGGLFNDSGELVGIIVAKSISTDVEGIGFAIPIDDVKELVAQIISGEYVASAASSVYIGIQLIDISSMDIARQYNLTKTGIYVTQVFEDGPAAHAGIETGDLIIGVDDKEVTNLSDYKAIMKDYQVGDTVKLNILRGSRIVNVNVKLAESPE